MNNKSDCLLNYRDKCVKWCKIFIVVFAECFGYNWPWIMSSKSWLCDSMWPQTPLETFLNLKAWRNVTVEAEHTIMNLKMNITLRMIGQSGRLMLLATGRNKATGQIRRLKSIYYGIIHQTKTQETKSHMIRSRWRGRAVEGSDERKLEPLRNVWNVKFSLVPPVPETFEWKKKKVILKD